MIAGCPLEPETFAHWQRHFAPPAQPFFVSDALAQQLPAWPRFTRQEFGRSGVPLSLQDTFTTYNVTAEASWVIWLTFEAFSKLSDAEKFSLLEEQRRLGRGGVVHLTEVAGLLETRKLEPGAVDGLFAWWPQLWKLLSKTEKYNVLRAFVETDRLHCERGELTADDWQRVSKCLLSAHALAGSFLPESGGNCFGTVIAAFGAPAVAAIWVHPEPFMRWLESFVAASTLTSSIMPGLGDVLVWVDDNARIQHAAVSLGNDFVLHKEAQSWFAPRQVMRFGDALTRWQDDSHLHIYKPE